VTQSPSHMLAGIVGRGALAAVLVGTLALAGCGRKAGLDPPPMAAGEPQYDTDRGGAPARLGPDGKPLETHTDKRRTIFDWLIN
jgi:hypothetical protein